MMWIRSYLAVLLAAAANAQAPVAFEVASLKPAAPLVGSSRYAVTASGIDISYQSMTDLLTNAYRVKDFQISGPDWLNDVRFDLTAKFPDGATAQQLPEMLQGLLAERFGLKIHHDFKAFSGYALVPAKGGFRLMTDDDMKAAVGPRFVLRPKSTGAMSSSAGTQKLTGYQVAVVTLIATLLRALGSPVEDQTGITGDINYVFETSPEDTRNGRSSILVDGAPPVAAVDSGAPLLYSSLGKMGLKLESQKIRMDAIVIDHIEKSPAGN